MADKKTITPFGFFVMSFSCVFGSSWLLLPSTWLAAGESFQNVTWGFAAGILFILTLSFSYTQIFKAVPNGKGEITYVGLAFGRKYASVIGWCAFLVNVILCSWQTIAITNILRSIFPAFYCLFPLYHIDSYEITIPGIFTGLLVAFGSMSINLRGARSSIRLQTFLMVTILALLFLAIGICLPHAQPSYLTYKAEKQSLSGIISMVVLLPFSIAGWENIAKGTGEASEKSTPGKRGLAMAAAIIAGGVLYFILFAVQAAILPPSLLYQEELPFLTGLNMVTGNHIFGNIILAAAALNGLNVYNGMFYGAFRALYSLGHQGYLPSVLTQLHSRYQTPYIPIILVTVISSIASFFGQAAFVPLVNISALIYVILWGSTVLSNLIIRKQHKIGQTLSEKMQSCLGILVILFMLGGMLIPGSPGALRWPSEYLLAFFLLVSGLIICRK